MYLDDTLRVFRSGGAITVQVRAAAGRRSRRRPTALAEPRHAPSRSRARRRLAAAQPLTTSRLPQMKRTELRRRLGLQE
jgi:hypothetical protein